MKCEDCGHEHAPGETMFIVSKCCKAHWELCTVENADGSATYWLHCEECGKSAIVSGELIIGPKPEEKGADPHHTKHEPLVN
jgi:hypothetical protein